MSINNYAIWAIQAGDRGKELLKSLQKGLGRFGVANQRSANLHRLQERIAKSGWASLSEEEKQIYQHFLLGLKEGDHVVYINTPEWGQCTLARVSSPYFWESGQDFNHRYKVDAASVCTFDCNDPRAGAGLRARLKRSARYWQIHAREEFEALLKALQPVEGEQRREGQIGTEDKEGQEQTPEARRAGLAQNVKPFLQSVTRQILQGIGMTWRNCLNTCSSNCLG